MKHLFLILAAGMALTAQPARTDDPAVPGAGFPASRYEALWTKSPFAVATAEATQGSSDYTLVGIATFNGISYASLIDKQKQEHYLISSDKATKGLTLVSIIPRHDDSGTDVVIKKDDQLITLKLEKPDGTLTGGGAAPPPTTLIDRLPPIPTPEAGKPYPPGAPPGYRSFIPPPGMRRPPIHLPPNPNQQQQPSARK